jgi:hypothetical protein
MRASNELLMFMLGKPTQLSVPLETDRCPRCQQWLTGRWTRSGEQPSGSAYLHRYVVCVACPACGYEAATQHQMNRSG